MNKTWKWILVGAAIFLVVFLVALPLFSGSWWGLGWMHSGSRMPMMGGDLPYNRTPYGMMPFGGFHGSLLGWLGFILMGARMLLVPLVLVGLIAWLVSVLARGSNPPAVPSVQLACQNCSKPVLAGWVACPYCGEKL